MLVIRNAQMEVFDEVAIAAFEKQMAAHLREFSPGKTRKLSDALIAAAVHSGLKAARAYGFTFRGPLRLYLELMFLFGAAFDTDRRYAWAAEVLNDSETGQMMRAEKLYGLADAASNKIGRPQRDAFAAAFERLANAELDDFYEGELRNFALDLMLDVWPEQARASGGAALRALFAEACDAARISYVGEPRGIVALALFMLAAGHGILEDPVYAASIDEAWAGEALPSARVRKLLDFAPAILEAAFGRGSAEGGKAA